jgi:DNA-binding transcriptional regulator/RsmH inhibitor MraZ
MTDQERRSLAQQIATNPLYDELMTAIEAGYTEQLIYADTEQARLDAQSRVRAARSFREDLGALLQDTPAVKGGFA